MDLHEYMQFCQTQRYQWGKFDCCTYAAGAIQVLTGVDCMEGVTPYSDETSAAISLLDSFGTANVRDVFLQIAHKHGAKQILDGEARKDGDICCVKWPIRRNKKTVDQSVGLAVYYQNSVFACSLVGVARALPPLIVLDYWRFPK